MRVMHTQKWISNTTSCLTAPDDCGKANNDVARLMLDLMPRDGQEHLVVVAMDTKGRALAISRVATGTVDSCPMYARDIFAFAMTVPLVRFIGVAHNHPSGVVTPSKQDSVGSAMVAKAGSLFPINLLWSIVVTHESDAWAEVPPLKPRRDPNGDDDEQKPKDEDDEPEPGEENDGGEKPEDGGENEDEDSEDTDGDGSEDEGEDEGDSDDGDEDTDDDGSEDGELEPEDAPGETDDDTPDPDGTARGTIGKSNEVTVDELKASVRAAFGIK